MYAFVTSVSPADVVRANDDAERVMELLPVIVLLIVSAGLYGLGLKNMTRARRFAKLSATMRIHIACCTGGFVVLALSLLSPLHEWSEQLFSAHMVQHELMMTVAAPLLVWGKSGPVLLFAFPLSSRQMLRNQMTRASVSALAAAITHPAFGWSAFAVTLWLWHYPPIFQKVLTSEAWHAAQHISFLIAAFIFWHSLIVSTPRHRRGIGILYLFTTAVHTAVLGALLVFDDHVWYPAYAASTEAMGVKPLIDQQWAGLIMWIPGSVPFLIGALLLVVQSLRHASAMAWTEKESQVGSF